MVSCFVSLIYFVGLAVSLPISREVPQEHSHNRQVASVRSSLNYDNPSNLGDPIFALLGNAAAAQGLGDTTDPDCLQQAVADWAFTNAKAANDTDGQVNALIFPALERNTGRVGLASAPCTSVQAVNPEIAAIQQHQDPASTNAAAINKAIVLELTKQIASVGGDPQDALNQVLLHPETSAIPPQQETPATIPMTKKAAAVGAGVDGSNGTMNPSDVDAAGNSNATVSANDSPTSDSTNISGASTSDVNSTSSQNLQTWVQKT